MILMFFALLLRSKILPGQMEPLRYHFTGGSILHVLASLAS